MRAVRGRKNKWAYYCMIKKVSDKIVRMLLKTQRYIAKVFYTLFIMLNYDNCLILLCSWLLRKKVGNERRKKKANYSFWNSCG
ncbi:hypothetical protein MTYM_01874 [Methylococcales bacterium]|nr:hypothetical protein MTYM_01874 [Methylococcales bacterium]